MKVLSPRGEVKEKKLEISPRLANMEKATIGFLHNGKSGGEEILLELERLLKGKYAVTRGIYKRKMHPGSPAVFLDDYRGVCDAAIVAVGDWGACTSWSVHDTVELEKRNIPSVVILTDAFRTLGTATSKSWGYPELRQVIVPHPIATVKPKEMTELVEKILPAVVAALTQQ